MSNAMFASIKNRIARSNSNVKIAVVGLKGGTGKSTISRELAFLFNMITPTGLFDCDPRGNQSMVVTEESLKVYDVRDGIIPTLDHRIAIYDFGGNADKRFDDLISHFDLIIIPYQPDIDSLIRTINSYKAFSKKNTKIMFICNGYTQDDEVDSTREAISLQIGKEALVGQLKFYQGVRSAGKEGVSLITRYQRGGVYKRAYQPLVKDLLTIAETISEVIYG